MRRNGFTILEVLIAMMILSAGLILLANSWSGSFLMLRKAQLNYDVALLLERKMAEIEIEYKGKSGDEIPSEDSGTFGNDYAQFSWQMSSRDMSFPDLSSVLVSQDGGADQNLIQIIKQMSEHISKSVKEVTVTILYKANSERIMKYSATTYFVDYDKELNVGLPGGGAGL